MSIKRIEIKRATRDTTVLYAAITAMEELYGEDYSGKLFTLMEVLMSPYVDALGGKPVDEVDRSITKAKERINSHLEQARLHAFKDESIPLVSEVESEVEPTAKPLVSPVIPDDDDDDDFELNPGIGESQDDFG